MRTWFPELKDVDKQMVVLVTKEEKTYIGERWTASLTELFTAVLAYPIHPK